MDAWCGRHGDRHGPRLSRLTFVTFHAGVERKSSIDVNSCVFRNSSRNRLLNDSMTPLSAGSPWARQVELHAPAVGPIRELGRHDIQLLGEDIAEKHLVSSKICRCSAFIRSVLAPNRQTFRSEHQGVELFARERDRRATSVPMTRPHEANQVQSSRSTPQPAPSCASSFIRLARALPGSPQQLAHPGGAVRCECQRGTPVSRKRPVMAA